ncbi:MAG: hypothetical protein AAGN82_23325 [Myxococcota bacterium]
MHELHYDTVGRLRGEDTFDGRQLRYRNDATGRPVYIKNGAEEVTELVYTAAGELTESHRDDGAVDRFFYNANDELTGAVSPDCEVRFERDLAGQIIREVQVVDGVRHEVTRATTTPKASGSDARRRWDTSSKSSATPSAPACRRWSTDARSATRPTC